MIHANMKLLYVGKWEEMVRTGLISVFTGFCGGVN
jgi:hypothetical protein